MNKSRRKWLERVQDTLMEAQADIEEIKDEEESAYDNLPEEAIDYITEVMEV